MQPIKCNKCGTTMIESGRERHMVDISEDDLTEGQMADYLAAELCGDYGDWTETEIFFSCPKCANIIVVVTD